MTETDLTLLRESIELARLAREHGNHPFGALLADAEGRVLLRAENTVVTESDCTGHAETNLIRLASKAYSPEKLATCTLYTSTEPCPMCAGAIFWGNVGRVVYALSQEGLYAETGVSPNQLPLSCREVFAQGGRPTEVLGPALEEEAIRVHEGFWR
ncbi:MAG: nucleoside deaminase [Anaerolineales bacterium]|nr:nucleoside deaminase [Anaerolineales bacterium]